MHSETNDCVGTLLLALKRLIISLVVKFSIQGQIYTDYENLNFKPSIAFNCKVFLKCHFHFHLLEGSGLSAVNLLVLRAIMFV